MTSSACGLLVAPSPALHPSPVHVRPLGSLPGMLPRSPTYARGAGSPGRVSETHGSDSGDRKSRTERPLTAVTKVEETHLLDLRRLWFRRRRVRPGSFTSTHKFEGNSPLSNPID